MGLVSALGRVRNPAQQVCYLFPEPTSQSIKPVLRSNVFVFQYWPTQLNDSKSVNYSEKQIPGGSHPIFNWVSGGARNISFEATFTSEIQLDNVTRLEVRNTPSDKYTVDVAAAIASLKTYLYPTYDTGKVSTNVSAPQKLILVMPGTNLGRSGSKNSSADSVRVILRDLNVTVESWFPSGQIRAATVSLEFTETIQRNSGEGSLVSFYDRKNLRKVADRYDFRSGNFTSVTGG